MYVHRVLFQLWVDYFCLGCCSRRYGSAGKATLPSADIPHRDLDDGDETTCR